MTSRAVTITLPVGVADQIDRAAAAHKTSRSAWIALHLRPALRQQLIDEVNAAVDARTEEQQAEHDEWVDHSSASALQRWSGDGK